MNSVFCGVCHQLREPNEVSPYGTHWELGDDRLWNLAQGNEQAQSPVDSFCLYRLCMVAKPWPVGDLRNHDELETRGSYPRSTGKRL